jgi:hypothetical protein
MMKARLVPLILSLLFVAGCSCPAATTKPSTTPPTSVTPTSSVTVPTSSTTSPGPDDEYAIQLAKKFCPAIYLDGEADDTENYDPDPVQLMVDQSLLRDLDNPDFSQKPSVSDLQKWVQDFYYLDLMNLNPKKNSDNDYKAAYDNVKANYSPTVYARVKEGTDYTVIQYWLFYYFNDWRNYHEGDWELVQLNFPGHTVKDLLDDEETPVLAAYSQHQFGQKMDWNEMLANSLLQGETHPIVYVAHGSHANYFAPGQFWSGLDFDTTGITSWRVIEPDQMDVVLLHESGNQVTEWLDFQGYWGEYVGFSISVLGLTFQQHGPFGPQWSDDGKPGDRWEQPVAWATGLPEYPKPFWTSFLTKLGDWTRLAVFSLFSPAELNVYDAQGNHVGLDEKGMPVTEIPGSLYINPEGTDYKIILIPDADSSNQYRMEIKGTDNGTMDLKAQVPEEGIEVKKFIKYTGVPVSPKMVARANIQPTDRTKLAAPGITAEFARDTSTKLEIDSNGDGVFETESTPGSFEKTRVDRYSLWWDSYNHPFTLDTAGYPVMYRGAWASRLDEARSYLVNATKLRESGVDTIMLGVDIVFSPETGEPVSLGDDAFIFYLQALKKAGFRVVIVPNPMHPNLDMGKGYEWDNPDDAAAYHRGYELLRKFEPVILKWAKIAREYQADGFAPLIEPSKLVWDYNDASRWLQEIRPLIRQVYSGPLIAIDTMHDIGEGMSTPYPYNYGGYDIVLGRPPAGRKDIKNWEKVIGMYIDGGLKLLQQYKFKGFGLYEWGGYTGGVWYEDTQLTPLDQVLTEEEAQQIVSITTKQANGRVIASFPRISTGWIDIGTPAFESLAEWYNRLGKPVKALDDKQWTYDELIQTETVLAGTDYKDIFQIQSRPPLETDKPTTPDSIKP